MQTINVAVIDRERDTGANRYVVRQFRECRCGQALDVCHRAHCPRCGANVPCA